MNQKLFQKITRPIFILFFIFNLNVQSNAQVELKLNPPAALFGFFQIGCEFPGSYDWGIETEVIFYSIDGEVGGGLLAHGKYYFNPDFGADKLYAGIIIGGISADIVYNDDKDQYVAFGFEAGYKWFGKRNILLEIGGGIGRISSDNIGPIPYARLMLGYRFTKKEKN